MGVSRYSTCQRGEAASEQSVLQVDVLKTGTFSKGKDLSNFDKDQIMTARRIDQSSRSYGVFLLSSR